MNSGSTHFKKGNITAKGKAGRKHKSTLVKQILSNSIVNVDERLYSITLELLNSKSQKTRAFAWKELLKYRLPKSNDISINSKNDEVNEIKVTIVHSNSDILINQN